MSSIKDKSLTPQKWLQQLSDTLTQTRCHLKNKDTSLEEGYKQFAKLLAELKQHNRNLWWIGNGGSSAICQHLSQDALNKLSIRSTALADPALLTCMANDYGYENVYLEPLKKLASPDDMLISISSSGNSENILNCAKFAIDNNIRLITLSGFESDNKLWQYGADVAFYLPSRLYGILEVGHEALLHAALETMMLQYSGDTA